VSAIPAAAATPAANGLAAQTVRSGDARFEVLSPTLIRTEYAGDDVFQDAGTFTAVGRGDFTSAPFTQKVADGWLTIDTGSMTLKYRVGSGRFDAQNLIVSLTLDSGQAVTGAPWAAPARAVSPAARGRSAACGFGTVCEAEDATLSGGAVARNDHNDYSGTGFVAGMSAADASITVHVNGVPKAGDYALQVRYANASDTPARIVATPAGGAAASGDLGLTSGWDAWDATSIPVHLAAGDDEIAVACPSGCDANVDTLAVTRSSAPTLVSHAPLGGYRRDLDTADGTATGTLKSNPGILYRDGWTLIDDSGTSLYDPQAGTVAPRPGHGGAPYLDGYVFGYGDAYATALRDLSVLTGPNLLLPRWAYGVWYSDYYDRSQAGFVALTTQFHAHRVPVDVMAIDTDFKSPVTWDGWEVDTAKFPDLKALLADWHAHGIHNTLNVHPSISAKDPKYSATQRAARGALIKGPGGISFFNWSDPAQLTAYFALHDELQRDGVDVWWLDWCCTENSTYASAGVTPDAFIGAQYAKYSDAADDGRGFALGRTYGSLTAGGYGNPQAVATGPWADKRTTLHFTGDTISTWAMLAAEVGYTPGESAATGLAAISHDIGGHNDTRWRIRGAEPGSTQLPPDLYARWVQLGTFQPIDRLHSKHGDRLPWQYPAPADASAADFLNLRENLLPLTYTLAAQARQTGIPITRPLYLAYPDQSQAYAFADREYLYGPDILVAPVTTPGATATTSVWFPKGSDWTDYFTGRTYPGGETASVTTDLSTMPVFVRSGGIVPTRTADVANDAAPLDAVTLTVAAGADGTFALYEDSGAGETPATMDAESTTIAYRQQPTGSTLSIGPRTGAAGAGAAGGAGATAGAGAAGGAGAGTAGGAGAAGGAAGVTSRAWTVVLRDTDRPLSVRLDDRPVATSAWSYDAATRTATVPVPASGVTTGVTVQFVTTAVTPSPRASVAPRTAARAVRTEVTPIVLVAGAAGVVLVLAAVVVGVLAGRRRRRRAR
jgi:hypothetical protein